MHVRDYCCWLLAPVHSLLSTVKYIKLICTSEGVIIP